MLIVLLYQWCTVKQINLLIKYIKSVLWRVVKRLSSIEDARWWPASHMHLGCSGVEIYKSTLEPRSFGTSTLEVMKGVCFPMQLGYGNFSICVIWVGFQYAIRLFWGCNIQLYPWTQVFRNINSRVMKGVCFPYAIRLFIHRVRATSRFECLAQ